MCATWISTLFWKQLEMQKNNQSYEEQLTTEQPGGPATSATFACSANV